MGDIEPKYPNFSTPQLGFELGFLKNSKKTLTTNHLGHIFNYFYEARGFFWFLGERRPNLPLWGVPEKSKKRFSPPPCY